MPRKYTVPKHIPYQPLADAVLVCKQKKHYANKLDAERAKSAALAGQLSQEHQTATIMQSQAQAVAPINAAIGDLSNRLAKIECGLPPTTVVPNPQVYAMPACVAAQAKPKNKPKQII